MATAQSSVDNEKRDIESREVDALTHLEERIQKTVALVTRLRHEKDAVYKELSAEQATLASTKVELAEAKQANAQLSEELNGLRAEKLQVRNRLEKLLGHIDQLGAV